MNSSNSQLSKKIFNIFLFENTLNHKKYVSSRSIEELNRKIIQPNNYYIKTALLSDYKFFTEQIIDQTTEINQIDRLLKKWIEIYKTNSKKFGYNIKYKLRIQDLNVLVKNKNYSSVNERKRQGWIYKITNAITGKIYIGQTIQKPQNIFHDHKKMSLKTSGVYFLYQDMRAIGIENFKFQIIDNVNFSKNLGDLHKEMDKMEIKWIKKLNTTNPNIGYNETTGGEGYNAYTKRSKSPKKKVTTNQIYKSVLSSHTEISYNNKKAQH